jgi:hypothetical protein
MLGEIGNSDAMLVRELPDGRLQLLDGHLRAGLMPDEQVPVLILDLNEAEADKLLLTLDPLACMANADGERLAALLETCRTDNPAIQALLDKLRAQEGLLREDLNHLADPMVDKSEELRRNGVLPTGNCGKSAHTGWCAAIPTIETQFSGCGRVGRSFAYSVAIRHMASITRLRMSFSTVPIAAIGYKSL